MANDDEDQRTHEEASSLESGGLPDRISETVVGLTTGVPPQIQRSFFKAFSRIFTAGAEWPAKYLEGRGKIASARAELEVARYKSDAADIASQQKARDVVNRGSAKAAVTQFQKEDMAQRAADFHAAHILREQSIREDVLEQTANDLRDNPPKSDSTSEIDDDWLTAFLKEASTRSSDEYKALFSRILSGEIRSPGSFSIGTVQSIARMNKNTADMFQRACNISSYVPIAKSARIVSESFLPIGENKMSPFGLSYDDYSVLVEEGLMRPELSEGINIPSSIFTPGTLLSIGGASFFIKLSDTPTNPNGSENLQLAGPSFTTAGLELRSVVEMQVNHDYIKYLARHLATFNIDLYAVVSENNGQLFGNKVPTEE